MANRFLSRDEAIKKLIAFQANALMTITIIVVNFNSGKLIRDCLSALSKQTFENFWVVVVDNCSSDGSIVGCEQFDKRFLILPLKENLGFAAANNLVALNTNTPWLATLNPDAIAEPTWIEELFKATVRYPEVTMFGSTQINGHDHTILDGTGDVYSFLGLPLRGNYRHPVSDLPLEGYVFSPCAAAALFRTDIFESVEGFDERFFCYCEDVDLGFRLRLLDYRCIQVRDAMVFHFGAHITGYRSPFSTYYSYRNRLWVLIKNMPTALLVPVLIFHTIATVALLLRNIATDVEIHALKGLLDGIRRSPEMWKSRRTIQRLRKVSTLSVAGMISWSPIGFLTRSHDVRPIRGR